LTAVYARSEATPTPTILSIHNLGYQGRFAIDGLAGLGIDLTRVDEAALTHEGDINLLKACICLADAVTTVSPTYAAEVKTEMGGAGLHRVLAGRRIDGILNGIDDTLWDPRTDKHIAQHFDADDMTGKAVCKRALQQQSGLPEREDVPLIALISRFAEQKGIDLFAEAVEALASDDLQFVVLGSGEAWAEQRLGELAESMDNFACTVGFDEPLAHRIEAGSDLFVMPSRYEPCGLNQLYSQRYGSLPIVRSVGGLSDTVHDGVDGFRFDALTADALTRAIRRAVTLFHGDSMAFRKMRQQAMRKTMGWDVAAAEYEALYRKTMAEKASA
jgi:starch synthase